MARDLHAGAGDAEKAADLLVAVAESLNDRLVAAQRATPAGIPDRRAEYGVVLDHLYSAVEHLQSHDLVNQLIDAQKLRVEKMRDKLEQALALASAPVADPQRPDQWIERSRAMLDCIVAGIRQIDDDARAPVHKDKASAGSVDLF